MGWGTMMVKVAGRKGGNKLFRKRGRAWMRFIGRKGGRRSARRR